MEEERETLCVITHQFYNPKIYDSCYIALCFALPLTLIGILYTRICLHLWRSSEHAVRLSGGNYTSNNNKPGTWSWSSRNSSRRQTFERKSRETSLLNGTDSPSNRSIMIEVTTNDQSGGETMSKLVNSGASQIEKVLAQRRQVIKLMISLVLSFALLSAPFHIRKLAQHYYSDYDVASNAATITTLATTLLLYFNSAMNPLLYICFSSRIRALMSRVVMNPCLICSRSGRFSANDFSR